MAFPSVVTRASSEEATAVTTHGITLPSGLVAGNLCIVKLGYAVAGGNAIEWAGTGFTLITNSDVEVGGSGHGIACAYRFCTGDEGGEIFPTSLTATRSVSQALRITGHHPSNAPEASAQGTTNLPPDPPNLTIGAAADRLWIACGSRDHTDSTHVITGAPTNYSNLEVFTQNSTGAGFITGATAERQLNAGSEDPDPFTDGGGTVGESVAATIVVHSDPAPFANVTVR